MAQKIYTKTGDAGNTSLIGGTKVPKSNLRIETYGTVDELNSFTGLLRDGITDEQSRAMLKEIQDRLFTIGSTLACDPQKETALKIPDLEETDVLLLEQEIDRMQGILPEMKSFVLPGGHLAVSTAHITRCVCRRAERMCVRMQQENLEVEKMILKYLNRLSDYYFVLSRYLAHLLGAEETPWKPRIKK